MKAEAVCCLSATSPGPRNLPATRGWGGKEVGSTSGAMWQGVFSLPFIAWNNNVEHTGTLVMDSNGLILDEDAQRNERIFPLPTHQITQLVSGRDGTQIRQFYPDHRGRSPPKLLFFQATLEIQDFKNLIVLW